ncbi:Hypothetical predicted protein [Pelobates cultripes]|uniref:exodeoxyribonuclease III n=1 Tax=Pelobates cultripes TaxID=61616 RepID=A0AAD1T126_PELCU|nr:Hypothetical predicted protein [Pelobates cultripes]
MFRVLLPDITMDMFLLDCIHRLPRPQHLPPTTPRDVLMRLHYYHVKDQILRAHRTKKNLPTQFKDILMFMDLSAETLRRRRSFKIIADALRSHNVPYRWGYPAKLLISKGGKLTVAATPTEGMDLLKEWDTKTRLPTDRTILTNRPDIPAGPTPQQNCDHLLPTTQRNNHTTLQKLITTHTPSTQPRNIKIITHNVRGLNSPNKRHTLLKELNNTQADIVCLQETHFKQNSNPILGLKHFLHQFHATSPTKSRGVSILLSHTLAFDLISMEPDPQGRFIILICTLNNSTYTIVNSYSPNDNQDTYLASLLDKIEKLQTGTMIICGDFNHILNPNADSTAQHSKKKPSQILQLHEQTTGIARSL